MSTEPPINVLLRAGRRAAELRGIAEGSLLPTVLVGAPSHTGAYLLQALEGEGWELRPKTDADDWSDLEALAECAVAAAADLDEIHKALSLPLMLAALEAICAAGLGFTEGETR
jgi:hypothetical protein